MYTSSKDYDEAAHVRRLIIALPARQCDTYQHLVRILIASKDDNSTYNKPPGPCADPEIVVGGWGFRLFLAINIFNRGSPFASRRGCTSVILWKPIELEIFQEGVLYGGGGGRDESGGVLILVEGFNTSILM